MTFNIYVSWNNGENDSANHLDYIEALTYAYNHFSNVKHFIVHAENDNRYHISYSTKANTWMLYDKHDSRLTILGKFEGMGNALKALEEVNK